MKQIANFIVERKGLVLAFFIIATLVSGALIPFIKINYNLLDYLPEKVPSTLALKEMDKEFTATVPNARVMVPGVSVPEALAYKQKLLKAPGVVDVIWLDDQADVKQPLAFISQDLKDAYYKDGNALFQLTASLEDTVPTLRAIQAILGDRGSVSGQVVDLANVQVATKSEIFQIMVIIVPLGLLLLMLTTRSWFEPVLLLVVLSVAIVLNMGTNLVFGRVSFITQSVAAVLQMAVSLDYAIFLLHRFNDYLAEGDSTKEAMKKAITKASVAILSSAVTTFLGFLVLIFMRFRIGPDLGLVLAKGIVFSLITIIGLLPVLVLFTYSLVQKAQHRSFLPSFDGLAKGIVKAHWVLLGILVISVFSYLAQSRNDFLYGMSSYNAGSREAKDKVRIEEMYGKESQIVVLVPKGDFAREKQLTGEIKALPGVNAVVSYADTVSAAIPPAMLTESQRSNFLSQNYSRIIIFNKMDNEGPVPFRFVEQLRALTDKYYKGAQILGNLPSMYDMMSVTNADNIIVNGLAVLTIGLTLVATFRSVSIPLLLLLTIETSIWINLAMPYFTGTSLSYIGYLIVSSVQLGATVDYGILYTQNYLDNRKKYSKAEATRRTIAESIPPLLPPASILTLAGFALWKISSLSVVSELGLVLGRGATLSFLLVIFFLPALYLLLDRFAEKGTKGAEFYKGVDTPAAEQPEKEEAPHEPKPQTAPLS